MCRVNTALLALLVLMVGAPYLACAWLLLRAKRVTGPRPGQE
jgi:hypothetical protein